jgi:hypothetical protein
MSNETPEPPFAWTVWGWLLQAAGIAFIAQAAQADLVDGHGQAMMQLGTPLIFFGVLLCRYSLPRPAQRPTVLTAIAIALLIGGYAILSGAEPLAVLPASTIRPARGMIAVAWLCMLAVWIIVYVRARRSGGVSPASRPGEDS